MVSWSYSPGAVRKHLNDAIDFVCSSIGCYCSSPGTDFTRRRKLPADDLIKFLIQFQSKSLTSEIGDYFTDMDIPPSVSAVIQQRYKLDPDMHCIGYSACLLTVFMSTVCSMNIDFWLPMDLISISPMLRKTVRHIISRKA
ncbi:MAG: hypothetical protein LKE64_10750 [Solobacterium sp.]|jgi:hypothetical protein|nr:hypothetical protein [Solobacterium sp.]MCH4048296.1 hypothetical protein [Solobacterium sp.]MCH4074851.1 hypothetical protein [Solobacterium sp.]